MLATLSDAITESEKNLEKNTEKNSDKAEKSSPGSSSSSSSSSSFGVKGTKGGKGSSNTNSNINSGEKNMSVSTQLQLEVQLEVEVEALQLSKAGRCALHALPYMLLLLRKLVQRDSFLKSPITVSMTDLSDEMGVFQMHELLYKIFQSVSTSLLPVVRSKIINQLPSELQQEWFGIIGDLVTSLQAPLPPAVLYLPPPVSAQSQVIYQFNYMFKFVLVAFLELF